MSRGPYPVLLMLAMSLPGTVRALGLGEIHVDSALNEPLSAQIDIVGATREELIALTAKVASREIFQRYGADRPAFLASATFKVGLDTHGRPVLNIRSTEAFTDPLVDFLVELDWDKNAVIREYSLLLDPPGLPAQPTAADVAMAASAVGRAESASPAAAPAQAEPAPLPAADRRRGARQAAVEPAALDSPTGPTRYAVTAGDTLRGIARRAGARSESDIQRLMIAVFRANPTAFDGNINRLHLGASLSIPSADALAAISSTDARREVHAQMTAWRLDGRPSATRRVAALDMASGAAPPTAAPAAAPVTAAADPADGELRARVQSLEQALTDMHNQLANESAALQDLKNASARAAPLPAAVAPARPAAPTVPPAAQPTLAAVGSPLGMRVLGPLALGVGLLIAGLAYFRRRRARLAGDPGKPLISAYHPSETSPTVTPQTQADSLAAQRFDVAAAGSLGAAQTLTASGWGESDLPESDSGRSNPTDRSQGVSADATTQSLAIDTELLERSYLDSLGIDPSLDTVMVDTSELADDAKGDLNTVIIDTKHLGQAGDAESKDIEATTVSAAQHFDRATPDASRATDLAALDPSKDLDVEALRAAELELDYNLIDLDATAQHVHMPSGLHERPEVSERRTSIIDVLQAAIQRDPYRNDLRMKLLETYYGLAAANQRAFLEVVRKLAGERDSLPQEDWNKIVAMGKEIAADDILFAGQAPDGLANCA